MQTRMQRIQLGELLIQNKIITLAQLDTAIAQQKQYGGRLGQVLVNLGYIDEEVLLNFLAKQLNIPFVDLKHYVLDPVLVRQLPESYARRFRAILLQSMGNELLIGMVDPQDIYAYDEISRLFKQPIRLAIIHESDLLETFDIIYRHTEEIKGYAYELSAELEAPDIIDLLKLGGELAKDAPVVRLLQSLFEDAVQTRASDIHIEPDENILRIRQRIDGILHENIIKERRIAQALTQRLKIMAQLNIMEHRLPQDGRFSVKVRGKNIDVRLSTMPTQYGESVVMRLLDRSSSILTIEELGMPPAMVKTVRRLVQLPYGMMLVTGPTGSGKTTTLYAMLNEINDPEKKIITVEDPVEYRMSRITQVQVNIDIDLTFSRVLRSALRQDPDIIIVGEIRDKETSSIALRAAITGHLVLATLHTSNAMTSAIRLIEMGNEGYLVASAVRAVMAQRLVRRICKNCIKDYTPSSSDELAFLSAVKTKLPESLKFKRGEGCPKCNNTGYKGRIGVYELLILDSEMTESLARNDTREFYRLGQASPGFQTLEESALDLAMQGQTSINEVMKITLSAEDIT